MKNKVYYGEYSLEHWMQLILKQNIILPDYQRHFVWKKAKTEKLIDSISKGEFIPPITIGSYESDGKRENIILDGQQRLTSIFLSYLGIFPNKDSYKKELARLADDNDSEVDMDDYDNILEWSFKELTSKGTSRDQILANLKPGNYDKITPIDDDFLKNHYLGFSYLVPQIETGENRESFHFNQQKYYATVFRNINIQGEILLTQESRKPLYYLRDNLADFFEPKFTTSVKVNDARMDFVRYIALISHWIKKDDVHRVAQGYVNKMENLYEEFIYYVAYDDKGEQFEALPTDITSGHYDEKLAHLADVFQILSQKITFTSIIDLDTVAFGLLRSVIFDNERLDPRRIPFLVSELLQRIHEFRSDANHLKRPSALKHLRSRMQASYMIYGKYML